MSNYKKHITLIFLLPLLSGCGFKSIHVKDASLFNEVSYNKNVNNMKTLPLYLRANTICKIGGGFKVCSKREHLDRVLEEFNNVGIDIELTKNKKNPTMSVHMTSDSELNNLFDYINLVYNVGTFGMIPLNKTIEHKVSYKSPQHDYYITNSATVKTSKSIWNIFDMTNIRISDKELQDRVQRNLIRRTITEAKPVIEKETK